MGETHQSSHQEIDEYLSAFKDSIIWFARAKRDFWYGQAIIGIGFFIFAIIGLQPVAYKYFALAGWLSAHAYFMAITRTQLSLSNLRWKAGKLNIADEIEQEIESIGNNSSIAGHLHPTIMGKIASFSWWAWATFGVIMGIIELFSKQL